MVPYYFQSFSTAEKTVKSITSRAKTEGELLLTITFTLYRIWGVMGKKSLIFGITRFGKEFSVFLSFGVDASSDK